MSVDTGLLRRLVNEAAGFEQVKRELEELRVSYDRGVASFAKMHTEALAERARRESAEAALIKLRSMSNEGYPMKVVDAVIDEYFSGYQGAKGNLT